MNANCPDLTTQEGVMGCGKNLKKENNFQFRVRVPLL